MSIGRGLYLITSKIEYGAGVGTQYPEGDAIQPVVILPKGVQPPVWEVIVPFVGDYILQVNGQPAAIVDDKVFVGPALTQWKFEAQPHHGPNTYVIQDSKDPSLVWVVPEEEPFTQIIVKRLVLPPIEPPVYPPHALFEFTRPTTSENLQSES